MSQLRAFAFATLLPVVAGCTGTIVGDPHPTTETGPVSIDGTGGSASSGDVGGGGQGGGGGSTMTTSCGDPACTPGQTMQSCCGSGYDYGCVEATCELVDGCPTWQNLCYTPLLISFDDAPVEYAGASSNAFSLSATRSTATDWPTARTPWLALDRNGNGRIDDGSELFGSMTVLGDGRRAVDGFEALRALDSDGDGVITERDAAFAELVLWSDRDGDRRSTPGELVTVAQAGIVSIDLRYRSAPRCDGQGNCEVERAAIVYRDSAGAVRTGSVVDVHLSEQR
jgi:hypothetical protein